MAHILIVSTGATPSIAAIAAQVCQHEGHTARIVSRLPERREGADLVMLAGDPFDNPRNFANVKCTFRGGKVIYSKAGR